MCITDKQSASEARTHNNINRFTLKLNGHNRETKFERSSNRLSEAHVSNPEAKRREF